MSSTLGLWLGAFAVGLIVPELRVPIALGSLAWWLIGQSSASSADTSSAANTAADAAAVASDVTDILPM